MNWLIAQTTQPTGGIPVWVLMLLTPMLTAALQDLQSYKRAQKLNPQLKFDPMLFMISLLQGLLFGLLSIGGKGVVTGEM